jgi:hypothetical protein
MAMTDPNDNGPPQPPKRRPPVLDNARPGLATHPNVPAIIAICCLVLFVLTILFASLDLARDVDERFNGVFIFILAGCPLLAVLFGYLGTLHERKNQGRGRLAADIGICLGLLAFAFQIWWVETAPHGSAGDRPNRVKCASNLKQIGTSIMLYLNDYPGPLPPDFGPLITETDMMSRMFVCPSSSDVPAKGENPPEGTDPKAIVQTMLKETGHLSYIYVGAGLTDRQLTPQIVLAYEPLSNHAGEGINVLYGDGSAQWLDKKQATHVIAELQAGHNPPRPQQAP